MEEEKPQSPSPNSVEETKPQEIVPNSITSSDLEIYLKNYDSNQMHNILHNVLAKNKITKIIKKNDSRKYNRHIFEIDIPTMKATNQQSSGRCWIFAGLNILREIVGNKTK
jgi:bleomycin hydrolase